MKKTWGFKIWQIIYPIGIYYVVQSMSYFLLGLLLGTKQETYMMRQMLCAGITIPFIMSYYRMDKKMENIVYGESEKNVKQGIVIAVLSVIGGAGFGMAVNNIIAMTPLMQVSEGFSEANEAFFAGGLLFELLGSCFVIPIAEELLYRGVVLKRLRLLVDAKYAIVCSALIFGAMHMNLVQFLYAAIVGLFLAFLLDVTGKLYAPILGHIAANTAAVLRQENGWLAFSYQRSLSGIAVTAILLSIGIGTVYVLKNRRD